MFVNQKLVALLAVMQFSYSKETFSVDELIIVITSQPDSHHAYLARKLYENIVNQGHQEYGKSPIVVSSGELVSKGDWTILALVSPLLSTYPLGKWFIFCNEYTSVRLTALMKLLHQHHHDKDVFLGHPVTDDEPTIIHHFSPERRVYPNIASGIALTKALLTRIQKNQKAGIAPPGDFTIDAAYELSALLQSFKPPVKMTPAPNVFCVTSNAHCATYPTSLTRCGSPVNEKSILFAIKTCAKFHQSRATVVMDTWGKFLSNIIFFTDANDGFVSTASIEVVDNVKPVQSGHCEKLQAILQRVQFIMQKNGTLEWLVVADDDTILGVNRLCEILSCYGNGDTDEVALGERYGYGYNGRNTHRGYDYITGGGGIVLSAATVAAVTKKGQCAMCPSADAPDDMWLGSCLRHINIPISHSVLFHQARPLDYPPEYLSPHRPVSFHKHWLIDPRRVYKDWFEEDDLDYFKKPFHIEL